MRLSIVAIAALLVASAGCSAPGEESSERPRVMATTTQVGSVAREVGGDAIDLTVLMAPGIEAHDFELAPEHAAAIERADLILMSGAGLEDWLVDTLEGANAAAQVHDLSDGIDLRMADEDEPGHGHDEDEPGEEGSHDDDDDDHGTEEPDPHYWLSAPNAIVMVENARDALLTLGADEAGMTSRADELIGRLETADAEIRSLLGQLPDDRRTVVTDHDALGYFLDEYGLEFGGSVFPSLDVSSEPSARQIEALVDDIRAAGVTAVFTESSVDPALARAVAEEAGARLVDDPIYTDSLGPEGSGADTMDGMLLHNARVIHAGLGGD
ncbi:MAG: metal ABC transporter substrate-binding protein [Chloroflexi bacterium]|nr:metal ABC transporter substrate-binding protein [Chloroflexota bacterium]